MDCPEDRDQRRDVCLDRRLEADLPIHAHGAAPGTALFESFPRVIHSLRTAGEGRGVRRVLRAHAMVAGVSGHSDVCCTLRDDSAHLLTTSWLFRREGEA